jgi:hypothetical protein
MGVVSPVELPRSFGTEPVTSSNWRYELRRTGFILREMLGIRSTLF